MRWLLFFNNLHNNKTAVYNVMFSFLGYNAKPRINRFRIRGTFVGFGKGKLEKRKNNLYNGSSQFFFLKIYLICKIDLTITTYGCL